MRGQDTHEEMKEEAEQEYKDRQKKQSDTKEDPKVKKIVPTFPPKEFAPKIKIARGYKAGGAVGSASKRADGCAVKGKTKGRMV